MTGVYIGSLGVVDVCYTIFYCNFLKPVFHAREVFEALTYGLFIGTYAFGGKVGRHCVAAVVDARLRELQLKASEVVVAETA